MIPTNTKETIDEYVRVGRPVGGFVEAVLSNNLREAFGRADIENRAAMFEIVDYCYNEIPGNCWGSPERVKEWFAMKRAATPLVRKHDGPFGKAGSK